MALNMNQGDEDEGLHLAVEPTGAMYTPGKSNDQRKPSGEAKPQPSFPPGKKFSAEHRAGNRAGKSLKAGKTCAGTFKVTVHGAYQNSCLLGCCWFRLVVELVETRRNYTAYSTNCFKWWLSSVLCVSKPHPLNAYLLKRSSGTKMSCSSINRA